MDKIAADTSRTIGITAEYFERISVEPVEPVLGTKPYEPVFILNTADHGIVGETVLHLEMPEIIGLGEEAIADQQDKSQYGVFFQQPDGIYCSESF